MLEFTPSMLDQMAALDELRELAEDMWQNAEDLQKLPRMVSGWKVLEDRTQKVVQCELEYFVVTITREPDGSSKVQIKYKGKD